jgi:antitoxin ParD1/3/4
MNVSLTPELERLVQEKVESGLYNSASEVIREALRLLLEQDELRRLRREELQRQIMVGIEQLNEGRTVVLDEETREGIKKRGRFRGSPQMTATSEQVRNPRRRVLRVQSLVLTGRNMAHDGAGTGGGVSGGG